MTSEEPKQYSKNKAFFYALIVLCAASTILLLFWLLKYSAYGIDFTDEGFYLVWIANPFIYDASVTQFGFVYHPLYKILNGDITALRRVNILVTFALAWGLTHSFLCSLVSRLKESKAVLLVISAALATSALIFFNLWIPTPSYNSLNLQALLATASGLVMAEKTNQRKSFLGWVLIGFGGCLAFLAKPSTALALAVVALIYLLIARKFSIRLVAFAAVNSFLFLLISAYMIDGSIMSFIKRHQWGIERARLMDGGHTLWQILRIDDLQLDEALKKAIIYTSIALIIALLTLSSRGKRRLFIGFPITGALAGLTVLSASGKIHWASKFGSQQGLLIFSVLIALVVSAASLRQGSTLKNISRQQLAIAVLFFVMPYIYAFGTNGNYWQAGSSAGIFWILSGLIFLTKLVQARASWLLALPIAFGTQAITASLIHAGFEQPYRQPQPLRLNSSIQVLNSRGASLILSEGYSKYISDAIKISKSAGFVDNTPLIDLTGRSPGLLYALGAKSIGQAWMIGAYPGSSNLAEAALSKVPCEEISLAWILLERDGPRSISTDLMLKIGADLYKSYKKVGEWQTAEGAGGHIDVHTQELYRPMEKNKTLSACLQIRKESTP